MIEIISYDVQKAVHEGGHVLVHLRLDRRYFPESHVTIDPPAGVKRLPRTLPPDFERHAVFAVAGFVAERLHGVPFEYARLGAETDFRSLRSKRPLIAIVRDARALLKHPENVRALEAIVAALLERRTLSLDEVARIVRASDEVTPRGGSSRSSVT